MNHQTQPRTGPELHAESLLDVGNPLTSVVAGGVLLLAGLRKDSVLGAVAAVAGGALVYRGLKQEKAVERIASTARDVAVPLVGGSSKPEVERTITINRPPQDVYAFWREPVNFAEALKPVITITQKSENVSEWTLQASEGGTSYMWQSRLAGDDVARSIRWESQPGADLANEGSITLRVAPGDRGTEARMHMRFDPPGGALGALAANHTPMPNLIVMGALRRIKSLIETGEVPTLQKNPSARGRGDLI